jgi:hypothetical protein
MAEFATVIAVNNPPGSGSFDVIASLLKGLDNAARTGGADFGIRITMTYVSSNNTVEVFDSGRKSIKNESIRVADLDSRTVAIQVACSFGTAPLPGQNPSFSATAQLLHGGDELGPPEQSHPQG